MTQSESKMAQEQLTDQGIGETLTSDPARGPRQKTAAPTVSWVAMAVAIIVGGSIVGAIGWAFGWIAGVVAGGVAVAAIMLTLRPSGRLKRGAPDPGAHTRMRSAPRG